MPEEKGLSLCRMKDMIFEADRKTARHGESVELKWDADMPLS